ncbi:uncharacterized protein LOC112681767 [Sipha flava]|uniref:Uncharacterized protein LOC112681767 n=1 Tax=Sipha flava TaxID=143950 RepID=A0A8B8FBQ1_9HEMI|nr:uncharacterized protein LOC112681767 [Sipha flava]
MAHITTGFISSLMVFILIMRGNVSRTLPEGVINFMNEIECHTESDCLEKNTYCDVNLNLCSQCLNCSSMYFRKQKKNIMCAKDISDCSICLNGYIYSEEIFFGGEIRDLCIPIDYNDIILPTPAKISSNSFLDEIGIIFITINIFLISLLGVYFYKRIWKTNSSNVPIMEDNIESLPPSYYSCMKLDNYVTDDVQEFHLFTGEQPPRNEWRHQNAVPFRLVNDSLETNNCMDNNENVEEVDGSGVLRVLEIEDPELHDEETMASIWTPSPPPSSPELMHHQNNNLQICPPIKRIRLVLKPSDEKSCQDEDNK